MRAFSRLAVAAALTGGSVAAAAPRRETLVPPIVLGMKMGDTLPISESWLITGALRAHGVDPESFPLVSRQALLAAVPSYPPAFGPITSPFGARPSPFTGKRSFHAGLDIGARNGAGVYAASGGTVLSAGWQAELGRAVVVDHGFGLITTYGHMSRILVKKGDVVGRGDLLGRVGSTGRSTGSHLHYEVRINGATVDPARFFNLRPTALDDTARLVASTSATTPFFWR